MYKTYLGNGQFGKEIVLAKGDAPLSKVHQEYERLLGRTSNTLYWLVNKFLDSKQFKEKRKNTQIAYEKYARTLLKTKLSNGKLFGDVDISRITQKVIRKYLDSRSRKKVYANRHVQFLKAVFNWGRERFDDVTDNPCQGVKLYREKPRQRYIEDQEYELVLNLATGYIPLFMELSYLCRARRTEIIHMLDFG
ncbi:hypothetical protein [Candidiatus Paracoxiella cheracis]|uniref:hypothetical protein n=1 Tax=Candidiatus Paracoxiella cheracis TaxID=3405120 RepID=UPI003BF49C99